MKNPNLIFMASFINGISLLPLIPSSYGNYNNKLFRITNTYSITNSLSFNILCRISDQTK